jgi:hypothetical protein
MNTLISKLMDQGIMQSPFENWQDENRCMAIAYCSEHFNALPYGELGQLIAEQAMDAGRTSQKVEKQAVSWPSGQLVTREFDTKPMQPQVQTLPSASIHTCDEAFASDAYVRGTAEVNSFMGFDYDEATTHGSASDQMKIQDLHNAAPALTHVVGLRTYLKLSGNPKMRAGIEAAIHRNRQNLVQPEFGRPGIISNAESRVEQRA